MADAASSPVNEPIALEPVRTMTPWTPPPLAISMTVQRYEGSQKITCTLLDPQSGERRDRHPCPMPLALFYELWGSGTYCIAFQKEDGRTAGTRRRLVLLNAAHPSKPVDAGKLDAETTRRVVDAVNSGATPQGLVVEAPPEEPEEEDEEEEEEYDEEEEDLEAELEEREREIAELRAELEAAKRGPAAAPSSTPATPPARPYTPYTMPQAQPAPRPARRRAREELPPLPPTMSANEAMRLWSYFEQRAAESSEERIMRIREDEEARLNRSRELHRQEMEEAAQRHRQSLESVVAIHRAERTEARGESAELRAIREELASLREQLNEEPEEATPAPGDNSTTQIITAVGQGVAAIAELVKPLVDASVKRNQAASAPVQPIGVLPGGPTG